MPEKVKVVEEDEEEEEEEEEERKKRKDGKKIILASGSTDRKKLFEKAGIPFEVIISNYEEDIKLGLSPEELSLFL
ncbi:MAG: hypothetical protein ACTSWY_05415, partial [Promethearchaeota archaeon]